jgi:hypothetical protein
MKFKILTLLILLSGLSFGQDIHLTNALVVGQLDKQDERYSIEIALTELLTENGVQAMPSLNILKIGGSASLLAEDSLKNILKEKGIDTYVLVSVRGFDKRFKKAVNHDSLQVELEVGHLFPIYRDEAVSVSFEFNFYRNGVFVGTDIVKCGNISSRETVIKRFKKKLRRRIIKKWK